MADTLVSTYQRYKAGTKKLVKWLSESVKRCHAPTSPSHASAESKKLTTETLIAWAQCIAASKQPIIDIDFDIVEVIRDAITGRERCAAWYADFAENRKNIGGKGVDLGLDDANRKHQHFLKTLKRVFEILTAAQKSRLPKRKQKLPPQLGSDADDLGNLFQHLELEETQEFVPESTSTASSKPPAKTKSDAKELYELDTHPEDSLLAVYCILEDLASIRMYTRSVWERYMNAEISMIVAGKLTESSFCMVVELCSDFTENYPNLSAYYDIVHLLGGSDLFERLASEGSRTQRLPEKDKLGSSHPRTAYDLVCIEAWNAIDQYRAAIKLASKTDGEERASDSLPKSTLPRPSHPFVYLLIDLAFEIKNAFPGIGRSDNGTVARNTVFAHFDLLSTFLFEQCQHTFTVDMELVAATQVHMDIYDVTCGNLERAMLEAEAVFDQCARSVDDFGNALYRPDFRMNKPYEGSLGAAVRQEKDGVPGWMSTGSSSGETDVIFIPRSIVQKLPVFALNKAFAALQHLQTFGVNAENCQGESIIPAALLYKAGRMAGSITSTWHDIEHFVNRQNEMGSSFVQLGKTNVRSVATQYALAMGVSLKNATAREPHSAVCLAVRKPMDKTQIPSHFLSTGAKHFALERSLGTRLPLSRLYYGYVKLYASGKGIRDEKIAAQWDRTRKLTPTQLLQVTLEVLLDDEPHMHFDILSLITRCRRLVNEADTLYCTELPNWHRSLDVDIEGSYLSTVWHTIFLAGKAEEHGMPKESTQLHKVCRYLTPQIDDQGNECLQRAVLVSSGHKQNLGEDSDILNKQELLRSQEESLSVRFEDTATTTIASRFRCAMRNHEKMKRATVEVNRLCGRKAWPLSVPETLLRRELVPESLLTWSDLAELQKLESNNCWLPLVT